MGFICEVLISAKFVRCWWACNFNSVATLLLLCTVCVFYTIRVWYIPYAYDTYHTRMVCFSVPYTYGCTIRVYVSHSIKHSIRTEEYIPKAYFSKAATKGFVSIIVSASFIIR